MGQHAEDLINGDVDYISGEWIGNGQGFPRTASFKKTPNHISMVNGITKWIEKQNLEAVDSLLEEFFKEKVTHLKLKNYNTYNKKAVYISSFCFNKFTKWVQLNKL